MQRTIHFLKHLYLRKDFFLFINIIVLILGLYGWISNNLAFSSGSNFYIPIAPSSACIFILLDFVIFSKIYFSQSKFLKIFNKGIVFLIFLFSSYIIVNYFSNQIWDIENIFVKNPSKLNEVFIGRMSPITAILFVLISMVYLHLKKKKTISQFILSVVFSSSFILFIGYIYNAPLLYGMSIIPVALPTVICFLTISLTLFRIYGIPKFWKNPNAIHLQLSNTFIPLFIFIITVHGFLENRVIHGSQNPALISAFVFILALIISVYFIHKFASIVGGKIIKTEIELKEKNEEIQSQNEEYKQINEELQKSKILAEENEKRIRSTLDNMMEGCQLIGFDWKYIYLNDVAYCHSRKSKNELLGKKFTEVWVGIEQTKLFQKMKNCLENRVIEHIENKFEYPEEKNAWFDLRMQPVPEGMLILSIDITERKVAELDLKDKNEEIATQNDEYKQINEELLKSKEKAEESDRLKTSFLQNMSHEIRTPMNAIVGFSGLLNKDELTNENRKKYSGIIVNSANQLLSIITNILTISSIESKNEKLFIQKVNLNEIINDLQIIFEPQAKKQKIEILCVKSLTDEDSIISTDKTKLTQILTNLISNALKFTNKGSVEFGYSVVVGTGRDLSLLQFYVKDSGIGISYEMHEKVFERFIQANLPINKKYTGTGLGLSISKSFVELMGGKIWVESEIEKGSTFYFTIPV